MPNADIAEPHAIASGDTPKFFDTLESLIANRQINVAGPCMPGHSRKACKTALLGGEAIEQPVAASAAQIALATAAVGPARGMR
jgi:hypothetical protein